MWLRGHHFRQAGHEPGMVVNPDCSQLNRCVRAVVIEGESKWSSVIPGIARGCVRFESF